MTFQRWKVSDMTKNGTDGRNGDKQMGTELTGCANSEQNREWGWNRRTEYRTNMDKCKNKGRIEQLGMYITRTIIRRQMLQKTESKEEQNIQKNLE
jgi:hypothetical protein